jgi:hypothetical protein
MRLIINQFPADRHACYILVILHLAPVVDSIVYLKHGTTNHIFIFGITFLECLGRDRIYYNFYNQYRRIYYV